MKNRTTDIYLRNTFICGILGNLLFFIFPFPPIVWRLLLVLVSAICIYRKCQKSRWDPLNISLLLFLVLNLIYFVQATLTSDVSYSVIGSVVVSLSGFISFSYLSERGVITYPFLRNSTILLFLASIPYFYYMEYYRMEMAGLDASDIGNVTNNASVLFLFLIPSIIAIKDRFLSILLFTGVMTFLILGAKRGNIIAAIIPTLMYFSLLWRQNQGKILKKVLILFALLAILWLGENMITENEYMLSRIDQTMEGNSSGRDKIYKEMFDIWQESDFFNLLMGNGFLSTIRLSSMQRMAHSDWLEVLVDFGVIGLFLYLAIFINFFFRSLKLSSEYKVILLSVIFIWFFKSLYSMAYMDDFLVFLVVPFSYALSSYKVKDNKI